MDDLKPTHIPSALQDRSAPQALKDALHAQLKSILDQGISPRTLLQLEQTASLAHKMLIVSGDSRVMSRNKRGLGIGGGMVSPGFPGDPYDVVGPADLDAGGPFDSPGGGPLAPAPFGLGENFGTDALRNLVSNLNKPKLVDTLDSLKIAEHLLEQNPDEEQYKSLVARLKARVAAVMDDTEDHAPPSHMEEHSAPLVTPYEPPAIISTVDIPADDFTPGVMP